MDTDKDYLIAKSIVQSGQSVEEWDDLRQGKGSWPDDERKDWKQFRNYSISELKAAMIIYKNTAGQPSLDDVDPGDRELFKFFCSTPPPDCYGLPYVITNGPQFRIPSKRIGFAPAEGMSPDSMMFVRACYVRVLSIVDSLYSVRQKGAGVIFTGSQGNSKSWCALFLVWHMLRKGRTVVYEVVEEDAIFILTPDGAVRRGEGAAKISYMIDKNTVHIFDAKATKAGAREPVMSNAFLVEFSSENSASFEQTSRRPAVVRYCIPSYSLEELLTVKEYFGVSEDEVRERVAQIGPSIRYVLVNDYAETLPATMDKAKNVTTVQFEHFLSTDAPASSSEKDVSAGLLIVHVNEDEYPEEPWQAYRRYNASWSFASRNICQIVYKNTCTKAQQFVRQFITEVNTQTGLMRLKGVAGNFLELMVDNFLTAREFQARRLCDNVPGPLPLLSHCFWPEWLTVPENKLVLRAGEGLSIQRALAMNRDPQCLYSFCKNLAGVDYLACDGLLAFQVTTSTTHSVSFDALSAICAHAREHYPGETVKLVFVVPDELISRAGTGPWRMTQSLQVTTRVDVDGTGRMRKVGRYCKFDKLDAEQKAMLANLEQWVLAYTA